MDRVEDHVLAVITPGMAGGREDRDLTEKLTGELAGILNWALVGLRRLRAPVSSPRCCKPAVGAPGRRRRRNTEPEKRKNALDHGGESKADIGGNPSGTPRSCLGSSRRAGPGASRIPRQSVPCRRPLKGIRARRTRRARECRARAGRCRARISHWAVQPGLRARGDSAP
jgi:hypothetical protein